MLNGLQNVIWIVICEPGSRAYISDDSTNTLWYLFPHWLQADFLLLRFSLDLDSVYKEKTPEPLSIRHFFSDKVK